MSLFAYHLLHFFIYPWPLAGPKLTSWAKLSSQQILRILLLLPPQYEAHKVTPQSWLFIWLLESNAGPQDNHFTN